MTAVERQNKLTQTMLGLFAWFEITAILWFITSICVAVYYWPQIELKLKEKPKQEKVAMNYEVP